MRQKRVPQSEVPTFCLLLHSNVQLRAEPCHPRWTQHQPYSYHNNISIMLELSLILLQFTVPYTQLQKTMIEQPQSDVNHQLNQLEFAIPNQTPAFVDLIHCYTAHLLLQKTQQKEDVLATYSIQGSIQVTNISQFIQLYDMLFQPNHLFYGRHL